LAPSGALIAPHVRRPATQVAAAERVERRARAKPRGARRSSSAQGRRGAAPKPAAAAPPHEPAAAAAAAPSRVFVSPVPRATRTPAAPRMRRARPDAAAQGGEAAPRGVVRRRTPPGDDAASADASPPADADACAPKRARTLHGCAPRTHSMHMPHIQHALMPRVIRLLSSAHAFFLQSWRRRLRGSACQAQRRRGGAAGAGAQPAAGAAGGARAATHAGAARGSARGRRSCSRD
jgi:hypothetical protein